MSARYSTSPALILRIGRSRLRAALYGAFCLVTVYALWLLCDRGYVALAALLALPVAGLLWHLRRDPMEGAELRWRRGLWTLETAGTPRVLSPTGRCAVTPWVIYLSFTDLPAGAGGRMWLFPDSAPHQQLRQLRVRLTLQY